MDFGKYRNIRRWIILNPQGYPVHNILAVSRAQALESMENRKLPEGYKLEKIKVIYKTGEHYNGNSAE